MNYRKRIGAYIIMLFSLIETLFSGNLVLQDLDYYDGLQSLDNPSRGFYRTRVFHLKENGNVPIDTWGNLVHLRIDISCFSDQANLGTKDEPVYGKNIPLTDDALSAIDETLKNIKKRGATAVVRVCYDKYYEGQSKCDPLDQSLIENHLIQLSEVWNNNTDVISYVELGMYGPWGEQHSSNIGSNQNIAKSLQVLLAHTVPDIKIGVRRPDIIAEWLGLTKKEFLVDSEKFNLAVKAKGDTIFRAGMYNDGYLGSSSDLGTIDGSLTREMMVNWLEKYSKHTPYGGELVANYNGENPINTPSFLSKEGFLTHTSYLNYEWHQPTILSWKDSIFNGEDPEYNGATGYEYVDNHLGYRFVLRSSEIEDNIAQNDTLHLNLKIQNVGFGNVCDEKKLTVLMHNTSTDDIYEIIPDENYDIRNILSRNLSEEYDGTTELSLNCKLPDNISLGEYEIYIRISKFGDINTDANYQCIAFGNPSEQYNKTFGANLAGYTNIIEVEESGIKSQNNDNDDTRIIRKISDGKSIYIQINGQTYDINGNLINF